MRRIFIILSIVSVLPFAANAQLSKLMSKYHEKNGVTVTQLDKSLYGLYQRNNLPPEANELLQKLEEVNILNLDLNQTDPSLSEKAIGQFREILDKQRIQAHRIAAHIFVNNPVALHQLDSVAVFKNPIHFHAGIARYALVRHRFSLLCTRICLIQFQMEQVAAFNHRRVDIETASVRDQIPLVSDITHIHNACHKRTCL